MISMSYLLHNQPSRQRIVLHCHQYIEKHQISALRRHQPKKPREEEKKIIRKYNY